MLVIVVVIVIVGVLTHMYRNKPPIYCIMITGKDETRYKFAKIAVQNFDSQTYKNKVMIIINHGDRKILTRNRHDVHEYFIDKKHFTLGDLRNIAFEFVPKDALWIPFDDDDWRRHDYLSLLESHMYSSNADAVFLHNRIDHNINTNFTYLAHFESGSPHLLCKNIDVLRYLTKDTLEDVDVQKNLIKLNKTFVVVHNEPALYVRFIHRTNTSTYVNARKNDIVAYSPTSNYKESHASAAQASYVSKIVSTIYKCN